MANLLAGREVVREFLQANAVGSSVAAELLRLSGDSKQRGLLASELVEVTAPLADPRAYELAANATLEEVI